MKDNAFEAFMDFYRQDNGSWSKTSSLMVDKAVLSTNSGSGQMCHYIGCTAPVQSLRALDLPDEQYLKHPVMQDRLASIMTFEYDRRNIVDIDDAGTCSLGNAQLGRIATA